MSFKTDDNTQNGNSDEHQYSESSTAYPQWHSLMLAGVCFFLTLIALEVEGQTLSSIPAPASAIVVPQTTPAPDTDPTPQNNGATAQRQPDGQQAGDDQKSVF